MASIRTISIYPSVYPSAPFHWRPLGLNADDTAMLQQQSDRYEYTCGHTDAMVAVGGHPHIHTYIQMQIRIQHTRKAAYFIANNIQAKLRPKTKENPKRKAKSSAKRAANQSKAKQKQKRSIAKRRYSDTQRHKNATRKRN